MNANWDATMLSAFAFATTVAPPLPTCRPCKDCYQLWGGRGRRMAAAPLGRRAIPTTSLAPNKVLRPWQTPWLSLQG